MAVIVRQYKSSDYDAIAQLYNSRELFGGEFSEFRDSKEVIERIISKDPFAVMVAEDNEKIVGTVSLIENERVAWLYRFCVAESEQSDIVAQMLYDLAEQILSKRGHRQVLVYTAPNMPSLHQRYQKLGFVKGSDYSCFWKNI